MLDFHRGQIFFVCLMCSPISLVRLTLTISNLPLLLIPIQHANHIREIILWPQYIPPNMVYTTKNVLILAFGISCLQASVPCSTKTLREFYFEHWRGFFVVCGNTFLRFKTTETSAWN